MKDRKNIFDTEIEMIDLDSVGNMELRYEELGSPNKELGEDLEMVMKETQVFSPDEVEKALEKNMQKEFELELDATRAIDPVEVVEGYLSDDEVAETVNEEGYEEEIPEEQSDETAEIQTEEVTEETDSEESDPEDDEAAEYDESEEDEAEYEESEEADEEDYETEETDEDLEENDIEEESEEDSEEETPSENKEAAAASVKEKSHKLEEDESYDFEEEPEEKKSPKKASKKSSGQDKGARSNADGSKAHKSKGAAANSNKKRKKRKKNRDEDDESRFGIVEIAGILVAIVLIVLLVVLGNKLLSDKAHKRDVEQFASIGALFSGIDSIGNEGIAAIGDKVYVDSITVKEDTESEENNETEEDVDVREDVAPVSVNFSSIEKDLKIKFVNKNTGRLITGVRFEVTAKGPGGKSYDWVDTDMDGVIYIDKLEPGNYEVKVVSVDPYEFPETTTTVKVQDTVVYQVINVIDEAVDMSQVNLAQEENQGKDIDQGDVLQDTVKFVGSTATPIDGADGFVKVSKSDIKDPKTLTQAFNWGGFRRVDNVNVTDIVLSSAGEVNVGQTVTIGASIVPEEATNKTLNWSSSNEAVATVDASGNVTGVSAGTVTITAKATDESGVTKTADIQVKEVTAPEPKKVTGINIGGNKNIPVGQELTLSATVTPDDAADKGITWKSSDESIASVGSNGVVKGLKEGEVQISATANDGSGVSASVTVVVEKTQGIKASGITVSGESEVTVGATITLKAAVSPEDASDKSVEWSSSDPDTASVDAQGIVTGKKSGEVTVTAKARDGSGVAGSLKIIVKKADTLKLKVTDSNGNEINEKKSIFVGDTYQINSAVEGFETSNEVTYTASNNAVTVSPQGLVMGVTAGSADITIATKEKGVDGNPVTKVVSFTVIEDPAKNTTNVLKYTKDGVEYEVFYKTADGKYIEAKWADYYTHEEFFIKGNVEYKYTGWQELNGNVYYFTEEGNKVTGEQVIGGMKYNFASDGSLVKGSGIRGIDVSTYNGTIDWTKVKNSGISFVIIRCGFRGYTQGGLILDSKYKSYIQGATAAGLKVGIYLFSQATNEAEAVEEASLCVNLAQGYKISYPIFIDSEYANGSRTGRADKLDKATRTAVCKAFCETIKSAGYTPGVYASKTWLYDKLDAGQLSSYKIWLAHYTGQTDYTGKYDIWQHSAKGSVNGINGNVDLDISYLGY